VNDRRAVLAWVLYDFANSAYVAVVPATVYAKYYALEVVGNSRGEGDLLWGWAITASMTIVALTAPPLGALADRAGLRKRLLAGLTATGVAATALMATVTEGAVLWGWVLAVLANAGAEAAFVHYNAYLPTLVPAERQGRVSAYGFAVGYLGSAVALLVALPFAGAGHVAPAFLAAAGLYGICALPALVYLPGARPLGLGLGAALRLGFAETRATLDRILRLPSLRRFLLGYFFFADGVNTVVYFSAVFAAHTLRFSTREVVELYLVVQCAALAGAWAWARSIDTRGPRFVVLVTLGQWCLVVAIAAAVQTKTQFFATAVLAGTALGAVQAASRTFMATLIPPGREGELFGFYALCGKAASVCGPLVFGVVSRLSGGNQRVAIVAIGGFFVLGLLAIGGLDAGGPTGQRRRA
jgi:UMF1 family MFS transporter